MRLFLLAFFVGQNLFAITAPQLPSNYLPLPLVRQEKSFSCGPASLLSVLKYWINYAGTEMSLYAPLKTTKKSGTNPKNIVHVAKQMGLEAYYKEGVTIEELKETWVRGETVILDLQAWRTNKTPWKYLWKDGHYIVFTGLDEENLYAMDPSVDDEYGYMPLNELYDRWHDFENENGVIWRNYQLAIFIKGKTPGLPFPAPEKLTLIE